MFQTSNEMYSRDGGNEKEPKLTISKPPRSVRIWLSKGAVDIILSLYTDGCYRTRVLFKRAVHTSQAKKSKEHDSAYIWEDGIHIV